MRALVFDTETTGLPETRIISQDTLNLWPHIVQFSYAIYDVCLNEIVVIKDFIIKVKKDVIISEESAKIHGITNKISEKKGKEFAVVLKEFFNDLQQTDILVGHNVSFDINMVKIELIRLIYSADINLTYEERKNYKFNLHYLSHHSNIVCTIKESVDICNLKAIDKFGKEYLKYPKLVELHQVLFGSIPNNLHNALNDILITLRCYIQLKYGADLYKSCSKFKKMAKVMNLL
jgi:DNA polymerase III epsilon subunit-like protein